jgi:hypothetical protein
MRAVAFALSLLVLGSFGAAAQQPSPMPPADLNLNPRDVAAIGAGALLGFFVAEPLGVSQFVGAVVGGIIGAWWYAEHAELMQHPQMKPMAARAAVANQGETPTLIILR